jgi:hypothetical protein
MSKGREGKGEWNEGILELLMNLGVLTSTPVFHFPSFHNSIVPFF